MWAMGREGEVVQDLVKDFEAENPGIRVKVQQIPWSAAHEKLLTAHVGGSTPDLAQLGNTWVAEFTALGALEPLPAWLTRDQGLPPSDFFPGIWDTNVIDSIPYGVPWYVDTRVLFYRTDILARAGYSSMPTDWAGWLAAMRAIKRQGGPNRYAIFLPTNEYTPWILFGLQSGSTLLADHDTRGAFSEAAYRRGMDFYMDLFHEGLAPSIAGRLIANRYQEFERGLFAMYISGPWDVGEFQRRLSPAMAGRWATAPLPGPTGAASGVSTAGGSSLVLFRHSAHKAEAWRLIEFLSRPEQQVRFYRLTGDLPARREAWNDSSLARDRYMRVFGLQLQHVAAAPKIPEWEEISMKLEEKVEAMVLGATQPDSAVRTLDGEVWKILEKRRWLIERDRRLAGAAR
jgi:multiple sugar transport system substrate-binding protein